MSKYFLCTIVFVLLFFAFVPAQVVDTLGIGSKVVVVTVPADVADVFSNIGALAAIVLLLTSYFKKLLTTNETLTIIISALISIAVSAIGYFLHIGIFLAVAWYYIFIYGLVAMALANGLSTWPIISGLLKMLKLKIPAEPV